VRKEKEEEEEEEKKKKKKKKKCCVPYSHEDRPQTQPAECYKYSVTVSSYSRS
jgi:hypothetical protein